VRLTPSARLLAEMQTTGESFFDLALRMSATHKSYFLDLYTPNPARLSELALEAEESLRRQREIEAADGEPFEAYLARYFAD
jgi:glutamate--cysteine ligase